MTMTNNGELVIEKSVAHPVPCYDGQDDNGLTTDAVDKSELTPDCAGIYTFAYKEEGHTFYRMPASNDNYSRALERTLDQKLVYIVGLERTVTEYAEALVAWVRRADALQAKLNQKELEAFEAGVNEGRREHYDNFRRMVIYLMFGVPAVAGAAFVLGWWLK